MPSDSVRNDRYRAENYQTCPHCGLEFHIQGFTRHQRSCKTRKQAALRDRELAAELAKISRQERLNQLKQQRNARVRTTADNNAQQASGSAHNTSDLPDSIGVDNTAGPSNSAGGPFESAARPDEFAASPWTDGNPNTVDDDLVDSVREPDDIKVEYHPKTKIPAKIYRFGDYGRDRNVPPASAFDSDPWHPGFDSRLNFEFAELILECAMNKKQIDRLLSIVRCIADDPSQFSFTKYQDIKDAWDIAGQAHPP
ncbi:hypothetical protein PHLCEN_2v9131, partial [Hermanssonia centrifuga]